MCQVTNKHDGQGGLWKGLKVHNTLLEENSKIVANQFGDQLYASLRFASSWYSLEFWGLNLKFVKVFGLLFYSNW